MGASGAIWLFPLQNRPALYPEALENFVTKVVRILFDPEFSSIADMFMVRSDCQHFLFKRPTVLSEEHSRGCGHNQFHLAAENERPEDSVQGTRGRTEKMTRVTTKLKLTGFAVLVLGVSLASYRFVSPGPAGPLLIDPVRGVTCSVDTKREIVGLDFHYSDIHPEEVLFHEPDEGLQVTAIPVSKEIDTAFFGSPGPIILESDFNGKPYKFFAFKSRKYVKHQLIYRSLDQKNSLAVLEEARLYLPTCGKDRQVTTERRLELSRPE
jgi:hypothetical protein